MSEDSKPSPRRGGRPQLTAAEKKARRNERDRKRNQRRREEFVANRPEGSRSKAVSPYKKEIDQLLALEATPVLRQLSSTARPILESADDAPAGTALTRSEPAVVKSLLTTWHPDLAHRLKKAHLQHFRKLVQEHEKLKIDDLATNTVRGMASDWRHWQAFCLHTGVRVLPISPSDLNTFIEALVGAGYRRASIDHLLYTLEWVSAWFGLPKLRDDPLIAKLIKSRLKGVPKAQHQAVGLTNKTLEQIAAALDASNPVHVRDLAMLLVTYDALLRASEVANLRWSHIHLNEDKEPFVHIPFSKTDPLGEGADVGISKLAHKALMAWREIAHPECKFVFHPVKLPKPKPDTASPPNPRADSSEKPSEEPEIKPLGPHAVQRAMQRLARIAGIEDIWFTGHSGRVGAAQDGVAQGLTTIEMQTFGRWKSPMMPARYARKTNATQLSKKRFKLIRGESG